MNDNTPNYILFLFVIICGVLFFIIANWIWIIIRPGNREVEGFANPQYTYLPDTNSPNLSIKFGLADLAVDISSVCEFIKVDSKLIGKRTLANADSKANAESKSKTNANANAETETETNANAESNESFDTQDGEEDKSTTSPSPTTSSLNGDYTVPYTQLQIYKMYNESTGYSSTSNTNIFKMMDVSYGKLFDSSQISKLKDDNIAKLWNANKSIQIDDSLYNLCNYFIIQSTLSNRKCVSEKNKDVIGLSSYFLKQVQQNKGNSSILLSLKNAYYSIIKPRFLSNTLSNVYWQNAKVITNNDKGTFNSTVFVLNTFAGLANKNTLSADLSANETAQIISTDTPFTMDSLWVYQLASIAFELYRYMVYFESNGSVTSGDGSPAITTTKDKLISGYPVYLQKSNQVEITSPLVFILKNPPSDVDCILANNISAHINNIIS